jgi:hypothetical protein
MTRKYEIHNQLTGLLEEADTWAEAQALRDRIRNDYISSIEGVFAISVLTENEDGSWTQALADSNGDPVVIQ